MQQAKRQAQIDVQAAKVIFLVMLLFGCKTKILVRCTVLTARARVPVPTVGTEHTTLSKLSHERAPHVCVCEYVQSTAKPPMYADF